MQPIAIVCFNRPARLESVCSSLANQTERPSDEHFHLFPDYCAANPQLTEASIQAFRRCFPRGVVHHTHRRHGIPLNILRARETLFDNYDTNCIYVFEDDMVVTSDYLSVMDQLQESFQSVDLVGIFSCHGASRLTAEEQLNRKSEIEPWGYLWGYGIYRRHHDAMKPLLRPFYQKQIDFPNKFSIPDHSRNALWAGGLLTTVFGQDGAITAATAALGRCVVNTVIARGINIGDQGEHFSKFSWQKHGFDKQVLTGSGWRDFELPTDERLRQAVEKRQRNALAACAFRKRKPPKRRTIHDLHRWLRERLRRAAC